MKLLIALLFDKAFITQHIELDLRKFLVREGFHEISQTFKDILVFIILRGVRTFLLSNLGLDLIDIVLDVDTVERMWVQIIRSGGNLILIHQFQFLNLPCLQLSDLSLTCCPSLRPQETPFMIITMVTHEDTGKEISHRMHFLFEDLRCFFQGPLHLPHIFQNLGLETWIILLILRSFQDKLELLQISSEKLVFLYQDFTVTWSPLYLGRQKERIKTLRKYTLHLFLKRLF